MKKIGVLISIVLTAIVFLIFNSEKLLSEYWFQKRIDNFSCIEPLEDLMITNPSLSYNIYDNSGIDLEITIRKDGVVSIGRNVWDSNNENRKKYYFITDKKIIQNIFDEFNKIYSDSEISAVDDHLSARYYRVTRIDTLNENNIEIGYYNVKPDKAFKSFKKGFLKIGDIVIDELVK